MSVLHVYMLYTVFAVKPFDITTDEGMFKQC